MENFRAKKKVPVTGAGRLHMTGGITECRVTLPLYPAMTGDDVSVVVLGVADALVQ